MKNLSYFLFFAFFCLFAQSTFGQKKAIDSLTNLLEAELIDTLKIKHLDALAGIYRGGNLKEQRKCADRMLELAQINKRNKDEFQAYGHLINHYRSLGIAGKCIEYAQNRLQIAQKIKNLKLEAMAYNDFGNIYANNLNQYEKALKYFKKTLQIQLQNNYTDRLPMTYNNVADVFNKMNNHADSALFYIDKSITLLESEKTKRLQNLSISYGTKGEIYAGLKRWVEAKKFIFKSLQITNQLQDYSSNPYFYNYLGRIYEETNQMDSALIAYQQSIVAYQKYNIKEDIVNTFEGLARLSEKRNKPVEALAYYKQMVAMRDSLAMKENTEKMNMIEHGEKDSTIATKDAHIQQANLIFIIVSITVSVLLVLLGWIYRQNKVQLKISRALAERNIEVTEQAHKLQQIQHEIIAQRDKIEIQNNGLAAQNLKNTQSIQAALTIQQALLPFEERVKRILLAHFVVYLPKDIVSGDFYWIEQAHDKNILIVADCTGHGVPGAFMSLIGISLLDKIILQQDITEPAKILEALHALTQKALKQDDTKDDNGMDIGIMVWDTEQATENKTIYFAGAKHTLYYVDAKDRTQVQLLLPDRKSIGGVYNREPVFETKTITLPAHSFLYMCSDGFFDQNNVRRKKINKQAFFEVVLAHDSLESQKVAILDLLYTHMKDTDQRDDITMIGVAL